VRAGAGPAASSSGIADDERRGDRAMSSPIWKALS
jgi:hypothetical protein